jgi:predicted MPP superfamily phosphohydrolase
MTEERFTSLPLPVQAGPDSGKIERFERLEKLGRLVGSLASRFGLVGLAPGRAGDDSVQVNTRFMPLPGLAREFEGARLVHISDLHCSPIVAERHLRRCVEIINLLEPDFVAITGDFLTTGPRYWAARVAAVLRNLAPKVGTVACLGNHDYGVWHPCGLGRVRGLPEFLSERLAHAGLFVLRNGCRTFFRGDSAIQFVGLEDYWTPAFDAEAAFEYVDADSPTVALTHNPDAAPQVAAHGADWILAGHTHGKATPPGGFWDAVYPTRFRKFVAGEYALGPHRLYVNRGVGSTLTYRRPHKAEITLFTLCPADRSPLAGRLGCGSCGHVGREPALAGS